MRRKSDVPFYTVDAFTDTPFRGNPAAVCLLSRSLPDEAMQRIANEMNLSDTAFVKQPGEDGVRGLRWFTPTVEVPLCGHATLATAHVLLTEEGEAAPLRFSTASGTLTVERAADGALSMDFPVDPPEIRPPPPGLLSSLGCPRGVPSLRAGKLWVVRLGSEKEVLDLAPDFDTLSDVDLGDGALGVAVTAPGEEADFVSRFFAPWAGIDEDPVTGVAHTALAPYWAEEFGRTALRAEQLSRRGGEAGVRVAGDRVHLVGHAVTVARGRIRTSRGR